MVATITTRRGHNVWAIGEPIDCRLRIPKREHDWQVPTLWLNRTAFDLTRLEANRVRGEFPMLRVEDDNVVAQPPQPSEIAA